MSDLFDPEPVRWGLRGDPWVWRAMSEQLTGLALPPAVGEVERLLKATFERVVACDLATESAPWLFREEFAHGGMSSGSVHLETWRTELLPTLLDRARSQLSG